MSTKNTVENLIQSLIDGVNDITGKQETNLTDSINALASGYGVKEPTLQDREIEENGTYMPEEGYDGFGQVIVNVIEDLSNIAGLLGEDVENSKLDIETNISNLIDLANTTTGNTDTNLTDSVNALVDGFGQGGYSGGENLDCFVSDTNVITGLCISLKNEFVQHESGNIVLL